MSTESAARVRAAPPPGVVPPRPLLRAVGRAIGDYRMIREGDRLLLGVSGGKDSLSLLHVLRHLQRTAPVRFHLAAATVDPQVPGFDPSPLRARLAELGIPYYYASEAIFERAQQTLRPEGSYCAYCARMRRGVLYATARAQGCNVLVLAQHLDDLAESFLMSAFYNGRLRTMKAHYVIDAGDLRVIRPLAYVRERQLADFAARARLPVIPDNCPACFRHPMERQHMKTLLAAEEQRHRRLFASLLESIRPLLGEPPSES